jgi:tetratricopeptide (TPR) repeat protein
MKIKIRYLAIFMVIAIFALLGFSSLSIKNSVFAQEGVVSKKSDVSQRKDIIKNGKKYYRAKQYEAAIEEWEKILDIDPGDKEARKYINEAEAKLERQRRKDVRLINITTPPKEILNVLSLD